MDILAVRQQLWEKERTMSDCWTGRWFAMTLGVVAVGLIVAGCQECKQTMSGQRDSLANQYDVERGAVLAEREADWRNGALVYQVLVDRFAASENLDAKRHLYPAPKKLRGWDELPKPGHYHPKVGVQSHEIDFWGGDLQSVRRKLDHVQQLGADVLYLNPIHKAYTNHKYDAQDYFEVSPEYGTRADVKELAEDLHGRGMKLVLDGVFNHMGRTSDWFQEAMSGPNSSKRDWFYIDPKYKHGYRAWANVVNLPELNLENPDVRARIYGDKDSVVQSYLRDGVDGWRLDVAFDIGFVYLRELTEAAHKARPGSLVTGEIWNYPEAWSPSVDSVMNFHAAAIIQRVAGGKLSGACAGRMLERMISDAGMGHILKAWLVLDNHDTQRLTSSMPDQWRRRIARVLQMTVPGSPCIYYGSEVGMKGGWDPRQRGPMRWDLVSEDNLDYVWMRDLLAVRQSSRALRVGDFRLLDSEKLLAFMRVTDRVADTSVVVANATDEPVTEIIALRDSKLMNWEMLKNVLGEGEARIFCGIAEVTVPAHTAWILQPVISEDGEYCPYKRVQ